MNYKEKDLQIKQMCDFLENTICQFRQQKTIAVNLNPFIEIEKKQLCINCLVVRASSNYQIVLNEEFKKIVKEIRINEYEKNRRIFEESQSNYNQICSKLQNNQEYLNANMNKTLNLIKNYVEDQKKCFEQYSKPDISICQQDLLILNEKQNSVLSTESWIQNLTDKDKEFQKILLEQFRNLYSENLYLEILKFIDKIQESNQNREIEIDSYSQYQNSKKTPFLQHVCSKHGKEIGMFTLVQDYKEERKLCIDCIPNVTTKLTTLEEVNKMWLIHQGEKYDSNSNFLSGREQIQQHLSTIIYRFQEKGRIMQDEIIKLIKIQNQDIETKIAELELSKNKKQLVQLEQKEIQTIINLLSQSDRMSQAKEFQMKLKLEDKEYQNQILKKLNEIEQVQKDCRQELYKLFDVNDTQIQETNIQLQQQVEIYQEEIIQKEICYTRYDEEILDIY